MFKVAGPMWAQATVGGDNVFARLVKTGKKVLRRVLQQREIESSVRELPKPTWSLRSQTVKVDESASGRLIGRLFPKHALKTQAAEARKQAALRLIRDARKVPVFAFVGLTFGAALDRQKEADDPFCSGIRDLFKQYGGKEQRVEEGGHYFSLQSLQLGQLIGQGCNAAVFEARPADAHCAEGSEECDEAEANGHITTVADQLPESEESQIELSDENTLNATEQPPTVFSNDDDLPSLCESTDNEDDDISIISEDEEETGAEESVEGWVLYRVSSVTASATDETFDDSASDIIILAGDEDGLESLPDLGSLDPSFSWSVVGDCAPETVTADGIASHPEHTESGGSAPDTSFGSSASPGPEHLNTASATSEEPEPAPNIPEGREFPLAVKMMYNYSVESRADQIMSAMVRETVPALSHMAEAPGLEHSSLSMIKRLPPHPNIISMYDVFVDQTPDLPEGTEWYPSALPPRLNQDGGYGRNATMFLVMKKYTMTLNEFLSAYSVDMRTRCLLFAQLLEGVAHLGSHGIAHRDLKSNNVLVDLSDGTDCPRLAISDFGSCLADRHYGLKLPYLTSHTDRGGNSALMAPEIKCAVPGPDCVLDYSRADLWAAGTVAHELFGEGNPFYNGLDSRSYCEQDVPELPGDTPEVVVKLVGGMLKRNPAERPSPAVAATCLELYLWGPSEIHPFCKKDPQGCSSLWKCKEISHWLERLTMETVCQKVFGTTASRLDLQIKSTFLSRVSQRDIFGVVSFEG